MFGSLELGGYLTNGADGETVVGTGLVIGSGSGKVTCNEELVALLVVGFDWEYFLIR